MENLNLNATEMVNNSVESNNATMGNIEELTKVFEKEEKELNRLVKKLSHSFVNSQVCRAFIKILNTYPISRALSMPGISF